MRIYKRFLLAIHFEGVKNFTNENCNKRKFSNSACCSFRFRHCLSLILLVVLFLLLPLHLLSVVCGTHPK